MLPRTLAAKLKTAATQYPVVTVTGPRQSGKTTLVRSVFKDFAYISLELPDQRALALEDPRGFLSQFTGPAILDEAQRAPELFSYLQAAVDERGKNGQFILSGSQNFLLLQSISQSLAGRTAVLHLLPFSLGELLRRPEIDPATLGRDLPELAKPPRSGLMDTLFTGFYPRIHDRKLEPQDWLGNYYQTYLERDVRNILQVGDLEAFARFLKLCAGRNGQLLNLSGLASDCGITHTTARRWLSVLEASFIIMLLRPYHRNFGKRLIKSPKLYFLDSGLLCYLLNVENAQHLFQHSSRGAVFESFVAAELYKNFTHRGERPGVFFWRDSNGHEIDLVIELGRRLIAVEIKSAQTIAADFFTGLDYAQTVFDNPTPQTALIYGGAQALKRKETIVYPWFSL